MISNSKSKLIRSLRQKKYRDQLRLFPVEGAKMVLELVGGAPGNPYRIHELIATREWLEKNEKTLQRSGTAFTEASEAEIKKLSNQVTPQPVIALVNIPPVSFSPEMLLNTPVLAFESVRDPGNLGTVIRTADWFGIRQIVCTPDSTDRFNPKVVQSTMGAYARVQVHYLDLHTLLESRILKEKPVFGTFMEGENLYETSLGTEPLILFGNESQGISGRITSHISRRITIPSFAPSGAGSESLNLAAAVAIVCSELRRRQELTQSGNSA